MIVGEYQMSNQSGEIRNYFIAMTVRSGSTLLSDYLRSSGLGMPTEYFQFSEGDFIGARYRDMGVMEGDQAGFFASLFHKYEQNALFSSKMIWDHRNFFVDRYDACFGSGRGEALLSEATWVLISRRDKISQALSAWRAEKSGKWFVYGEPSSERFQEYDFKTISNILTSLIFEEQLWTYWFESRNIRALKVVYEDYIIDPEIWISTIADHIFGGAVPEWFAPNPISDLRQQRDEWTDRLKDRFLNDCFHLGVDSYWNESNT